MKRERCTKLRIEYDESLAKANHLKPVIEFTNFVKKKNLRQSLAQHLVSISSKRKCEMKH